MGIVCGREVEGGAVAKRLDAGKLGGKVLGSVDAGEQLTVCQLGRLMGSLVNPHIVHHHFVLKVPGWNISAQGSSNGQIKDDVHRVCEWPVVSVGIDWFRVLEIRGVDVPIYADSNELGRPPELVGMKILYTVCECCRGLVLCIAITFFRDVVVAIKVQCSLNSLILKILCRPFGNVNFTRIWPGTLSKQPDGGPGTRFCGQLRFDLHVAIGVQRVFQLRFQTSRCDGLTRAFCNDVQMAVFQVSVVQTVFVNL